RVDHARTYVTALENLGALRAQLDDLEAGVHELLDRVTRQGERTLSRRADMQYVGQGHVVEVELPGLDTDDFFEHVRRRFADQYASMYGYEYADATPQIVALRVVGSVTGEPFE